jgi:acyl carrier protein
MQLPEEKIATIISDKLFELTYKKVSSADEELVYKGILTSITMVELAIELERAFSVSISFMDINTANFKSVNAIKELIKKTAAK